MLFPLCKMIPATLINLIITCSSAIVYRDHILTVSPAYHILFGCEHLEKIKLPSADSVKEAAPDAFPNEKGLTREIEKEKRKCKFHFSFAKLNEIICLAEGGAKISDMVFEGVSTKDLSPPVLFE